MIRLQNRIDLADSEAKDLLREMFSTQAALEQKLRVKDNDIEAKTVQLAELQRQLTEQKITHESRLDLHQSELEGSQSFSNFSSSY